MVSEILKLYNCESSDRRQINLPVENDRRTGIDRRQTPRHLDSKLKDDIQFVKNSIAPKQKDKYTDRSLIFTALDAVAPFRRFDSVYRNYTEDNKSKALGLLALAAINLPEDTRDLKLAVRDVVNKTKESSFERSLQTEFSFFRGTFLEKYINKLNKLGWEIQKFDVSLYNTKFGQKIAKFIGAEVDFVNKNERTSPKILKISDDNYIIQQTNAEAYMLRGSKFAKFVGKVMLRIPALTIFVLSVLELPSIISAYSNSKTDEQKLKNSAIQVAKATSNVGLLAFSAGTLGAILHSRNGHVGSLVGIGVGSILGLTLSEKVNEHIDKLFK